MPITKANGDMYPSDFVDYCWSPLVGGCPHQCSYCYAMKTYGRYKYLTWKDMPHWASEVKAKDGIAFQKLTDGKIFVCHTTDLFADLVPKGWIERILNHCWETWAMNGENKPTEFILQTKNPARYNEFEHVFERFPNTALRFGITLETDVYDKNIGLAPRPIDRAMFFKEWLDKSKARNFVTIEPIMQFNLRRFVGLLCQILPDMVWIGADSKHCGLPEPNQDELVELINELSKFTVVKLKKNLNRLLPKEMAKNETG